MIDLNQILCPTDFSPSSHRAFEQATALARWYEAEITLLHVRPLTMVPTPAMAYLPVPPPPQRPLTGVERERLMAKLRAFAAPAREAGVPVPILIAEGDPAAEIVREAQDRAANLVVMGTRGRKGLERLFLGSVAETVLRQAPCPVLTVSPVVENSPRPGAFRRILCPLDLLDGSPHTARFALSLAQEAGAQVVLFHFLEGGPYPAKREPFGVDLSYCRSEAERFARFELQQLLPDQVRDWCLPQVEVVSGQADREILAAAERYRSDLVVMGAHSSAFEQAVFGSTAQHVVRAATCPVLTVRPQARIPERSTGELVSASSSDGREGGRR